ncbi:chromosome-associated kinesin KIF4 [Carex littledalei]|uniref:Kinesin-like protein n=1 Tax=Carex littledalei TaxID=544730 RepID=A0A833R7R8_9POAL|nr:chromosome-associated kinesin KIF4 [Carex littledalei]
MEGSDDSVKVAVNIRPLITSELLDGCTDCVTVTPGEPQVQINSHVFTYDHVYGSSGPQSCRIFQECIMPLVDAVFRGYNATVLGYGQTGSGKTYTMGTYCSGETNAGGVIPKVMEEIFEKVNKRSDNVEFLIRVSFIEIFNEEVFDLLDPQSQTTKSACHKTTRMGSRPNRVPIQIKETALGGITLAGVIERTLKSKEEMASLLAQGSSNRATASTYMNSQSSRSHAVFTICIEQKRTASSSQSDVGDDILISKLHLVDLAGSESAKRTGADGLRLKEGININKGLLALGNVISALSDEKKCKEGAFVPYRDSKLTRLLQDSLGGNSKTVMIACISPADSNAEETINTLKYANRARNIRNKAVINRNPVAAEMQRLRSQIEQLQGELLLVRSGGASLKEIQEDKTLISVKNQQILHDKVSELEMENRELHSKCDDLAEKASDAQISQFKKEKDNLMANITALEAKIDGAEAKIDGAGSEDDDAESENDGYYNLEFIKNLGYDLPAPICSCTGTPHPCVKKGQSDWRSLCCTAAMSIYPLPKYTYGRKMSLQVFRKHLINLHGENYNFEVAIDLKELWNKHGSNQHATKK